MNSALALFLFCTALQSAVLEAATISIMGNVSKQMPIECTIRPSLISNCVCMKGLPSGKSHHYAMSRAARALSTAGHHVMYAVPEVPMLRMKHCGGYGGLLIHVRLYLRAGRRQRCRRSEKETVCLPSILVT